MSAEEFYNWMAYDMLKDKKFKQRIDQLIMQDMDGESRSAAIKAMFDNLMSI